LPAQFFAAFRREGGLERERLLMLAVLEDAVDCYQKYAHSRDPRGRQMFDEAREWVTSSDRSWLFSFENIPKTLATYPRWLIETHTPIVFAGLFVFRIAPLLGWTLLAVFAPSRWADVRAAIDSRSAASMSAACRTASALAAGA